MTDSKPAGDRRGQHVALLGLALQTALFALQLGLAIWTDSDVLYALSRFMAVGIPIWFVLYLVLNQTRRVSLEALESEELKRSREAGSSQAIFDVEDEALLIEQARLRWTARWLLPGCTVVVAMLLLAGHFVGWTWSLETAFAPGAISRTKQPTMMMWFAVATAFASYLYARYGLAMARLPQWGLLRAGAAFAAGSAVSAVLVAIALMATTTISWAEPVSAYILRVGMILLGLEFAVNFILDLYRPRVPGEVPQPSFDSRLLGMIGEPGGIAKSIAEAVNYQFGFQVSSTWFYQLLQRWLFPIVVAACAIVLLLSSVVVVDADSNAVIERFGRRVETAGNVLEPGLHLKWPYPIDVVHRAPVKRIEEIVIGEAAGEGHEDEHEAIVWTEQHETLPHLMLLVAFRPSDGEQTGRKRDSLSEPPEASPPEAGSSPAAAIGPRRWAGAGSESVPVGLLQVSVPIEFRIKDMNRYLYRYANPEKVLEAVAYRYVSDYAASVDIDTLMGPGRASLNQELARLIQQRVDDLEMGIEIVFVGIRAAHPPSEKNVAAAFQSVVSAETRMGAAIHAASGAARKVLTLIAGTEARARDLDEAIRFRDSLEADNPELPAARRRVEDLLLGNPADRIEPISGEAAARLATARAEASEQISDAAAKALTFGTHVAAFLAAPDLYRQRKELEVFQELENVRKFLIVGDHGNFIIEHDTAKEAGLDQVLTEGLEKEQKRNP